MPDVINFFTALIYGTILSAADRIGINPMLLGRQSSQILGPMIENLAQQFIGMAPPKDMEELKKDLEMFGKNTGVFGKEYEWNNSGNCFSAKVVECPWLEMAKYGKSIGYKACPLCGITIILLGAIEAMGLSQVVGINVDNDETVCKLKLATERK